MPLRRTCYGLPGAPLRRHPWKPPPFTPRAAAVASTPMNWRQAVPYLERRQMDERVDRSTLAFLQSVHEMRDIKAKQG